MLFLGLSVPGTLLKRSESTLPVLPVFFNSARMDPFGHPSAYGALAHCRVGQNTQIKKGSIAKVVQSAK